MRSTRVWKRMVGVDDRTVIEGVEFVDDDETVVVAVRPRRPAKRRCGRCERPAPGYDHGQGERSWRALDLGTVKVVLRGGAPRVDCVEHGVTVAAVPWARHGSGFTRDFEDQAAWLATQAAGSAVRQLLCVAWVTVGRMIARVVAERGQGDPDQPLFPSRRGSPLSRDAIERRLAIYTARAAQDGCHTLHAKKVSAHVLRHTAAMQLLHAGIDTSVIALWLGHENVETTQVYLHADLALKERAAARLSPSNSPPGRYQPSDTTLAFLDGL